MATATIETRIANPARKGKKKMAKKLSAKQLKYFGTKRQKPAARASRSKKRNAPKAKHRPRTKPKATKRRRVNVAGFVDSRGFHPIRSSADYDPDRAEDPELHRGRKKSKKAGSKRRRKNGSAKKAA